MKIETIVPCISENSISASKKGGSRKKTLLSTDLVGRLVAGFHAHDEMISVIKTSNAATISWSGKHAKGIANKIKKDAKETLYIATLTHRGLPELWKRKLHQFKKKLN